MPEIDQVMLRKMTGSSQQVYTLSHNKAAAAPKPSEAKADRPACPGDQAEVGEMPTRSRHCKRGAPGHRMSLIAARRSGRQASAR